MGKERGWARGGHVLVVAWPTLTAPLSTILFSSQGGGGPAARVHRGRLLSQNTQSQNPDFEGFLRAYPPRTHSTRQARARRRAVRTRALAGVHI